MIKGEGVKRVWKGLRKLAKGHDFCGCLAEAGRFGIFIFGPGRAAAGKWYTFCGIMERVKPLPDGGFCAWRLAAPGASLFVPWYTLIAEVKKIVCEARHTQGTL